MPRSSVDPMLAPPRPHPATEAGRAGPAPAGTVKQIGLRALALAVLLAGALFVVAAPALVAMTSSVQSPAQPAAPLAQPAVPLAQPAAPLATPERALAPGLVVLVRHAEKAAEPANDPPLSEAGAARALELARVLADAQITHIFSTETQRTMDTARPLAARLGLEIRPYNPRDLEGLAELLRSTPGRHLVVGHSNTTDVLSGILGGETFGELVEAWEYDRLYFLTPIATPAAMPAAMPVAMPAAMPAATSAAMPAAPGNIRFNTVLTRFGAIPSGAR
jgi:2,3-bisphosphoglycerate-dependent phosphoglycerate mutase